MKVKKPSHLSFAVGIMCHNEAHNILHLLNALKKQTCWNRIREIIVISSGSTDNTDKIVASFAKQYQKVKLIREKKRRGKAHAVNIFLQQTNQDLLVLLSGDLIPENNTLELLTRPFINSKVGIAGAHPVPVNGKNTFIGFAVNLLWDLHHLVSLRNPKMGEAIAFRKVFKRIHELSAVDEVNIESLIKAQGYNAVYARKAVVHNKGPETISDFIRVRRRIYAGHIATRKEHSYSVATLNNALVVYLALRNLRLTPRYILYFTGTVILECASRLAGYYDYRFAGNRHTAWEIATTTKKLR